jgi:hypothetical protein
MVRSGNLPMSVGSLAVLLEVFVSPPPVTVTTFVTDTGASCAMLTLIVIPGYADPAARLSARLQLTVCPEIEHVQPLPVAVNGDNPPGSVSDTWTAPLVAIVPTFRTTTAYAPVEPCMNCTLWLLAIVASGRPPMLVGSVAVLFVVLVSPPPETVAVFVTLSAAFAATLTVSVIAG